MLRKFSITGWSPHSTLLRCRTAFYFQSGGFEEERKQPCDQEQVQSWCRVLTAREDDQLHLQETGDENHCPSWQ
jgi:hypothetical protein